jgi:hypothetical protein
MASTYSTNLAIELIGAGEQSGTWGTTTNNNLGTLLEQAICGYGTAAVTTGNTTTVTMPNGASGVARNMVINVTGTGGASTVLAVPDSKTKIYTIFNGATGAITVRTVSGSGISVPTSTKAILYCDGTNVVDAANYFSSLTLGAALPVASGGTGGTSTTAYAVYTGNSGGTGFTPVAPGVSGNLLTSNGTNWASTAPAAVATFVSGMIILWSGSSASIPSGWVLCNGSSSTPDLRDRFVVGAGSSYAVGATGGSANATLVSHTHTASVSDPGHAHYMSGINGNFSSGPLGATFYDPSDPRGLTSSASTGIGVSNSTEGSSATNANLPPYYALCYIMKT